MTLFKLGIQLKKIEHVLLAKDTHNKEVLAIKRISLHKQFVESGFCKFEDD